MKKITCIFIFMLLILIAIPTVESKTVNKDEEENDFFKIFFKCYIEIEYFGEFTPKDTYKIRGIGLRFSNDKEGEITVYNQENGDFLLRNEGIHRLRILYLDGYVDTYEHVKTTYGQAILLRALSI